MRVTQQPVLRRFWYCVGPVAMAADGPAGLTLLDTPIVVFPTGDGGHAALRDRCCHRTAQLSKGWLDGEGRIVCGYHGWTYDATGRCVRIPQQKDPTKTPKFGVDRFLCETRYGYIWVCLDADPLYDIPHIPEAEDPGFRRIDEFCETWDCAPLRILENSFDNAHFTFVHRATFGDPDPEPKRSEVVEFDGGFTMRTEIPVRNPEDMRSALGIEDDWTVRKTANTYWLPFFRAGRIEYPNGLVHVLVSASTPVSEGRTRFIQWVLRNDGEEDAPAQAVIDFDRRVTLEDRDILEATEHDVPLDGSDGREFHMPSDKPGLTMRRQLLACLKAHGEREVRA